jgi:Flp pilus assembly protein TadD
LLNKAARLAPENPRVALERGVSYLHTPGMFGGGLDKAIGELERARGLFALQATAEPWPSWGRIDAYAWLGQALAKKGRVEDARRVYQEALEIEPNAGWIRFSLLPALDR